MLCKTGMSSQIGGFTYLRNNTKNDLLLKAHYHELLDHTDHLKANITIAILILFRLPKIIFLVPQI